MKSKVGSYKNTTSSSEMGPFVTESFMQEVSHTVSLTFHPFFFAIETIVIQLSPLILTVLVTNELEAMANLIYSITRADRNITALINNESLRSLNFIGANQSVRSLRAVQVGAQAVAAPSQENPTARGPGDGTSQPGSTRRAEGDVDKQARGVSPMTLLMMVRGSTVREPLRGRSWQTQKLPRAFVVIAKKRRLLVT